MWLLLSEDSEGLYCYFRNYCLVLSSVLHGKLLVGRSRAAFIPEYPVPSAESVTQVAPKKYLSNE